MMEKAMGGITLGPNAHAPAPAAPKAVGMAQLKGSAPAGAPAPMGGLLGLDYGVLAWVFKLYAVEDERSMLEDLQVMEAAAMAVLSERSA
jgi:hypothetical protein